MARLSFSARIHSLGNWGPTKEALRRLRERDREMVRARINELLNELAAKGFAAQRALEDWIPGLLEDFPLDRAQEALAWAARLAREGVDPEPAVRLGLPQLAEASPLPEDFSANAALLERLLTAMARQDADPRPALEGLERINQVLVPEEFRTALSLAASLAEKGGDAAQVLSEALPEAAAALSEEQFRSLLETLFRLAEEGVDPAPALRFSLTAVRKASPDEPEFEANLKALEEWLRALNRAGADVARAQERVLPMLVRLLDPEPFRAALQFGTRLAGAGVDPSRALLYGVAPLARLYSEPLSGGRPARRPELAARGPVVVPKPPKTPFRAALEDLERLVIALEKGPFDTGAALEYGLAAAARALGPAELPAALRMAQRLAEKRIDPRPALEYAVPALAGTGLAEEKFEALLPSCEAFAEALAGQGLCFNQSLGEALGSLARECAPKRLNACLRLAASLAGKGFDPAPHLAAAASSARALDAESFTSALTLASELTERHIDPLETLRSALPALARAVSAEQFRQALALGRLFAARHVDPRVCFEHFLPAMARSLPPEQFRAGLELVARLLDQRVDPRNVLRYGLFWTLRASPAGESFQANLAAFEGLVTALEDREADPGRTFQYGLPEAARALSPPQFQEAIGLARRLAERDLDPCDALRYGLPALAAVGGNLETFRRLAAALESLIFALAGSQIDPRPVLEYAVPAAARSLNADQLTAGLGLAAKLAARRIDPRQTLEYGLSAVARALPPDQFALEAKPFGNEQRDEAALEAVARYGLLPAAEAANAAAVFRANAEALEELAAGLAERDLDARAALEFGLPAAAEASRSQAEFRANLAALREFILRLSVRGVELGPVLEFGAPAAGQAGRGRSEFESNLQALTGFVTRLREAEADVSQALRFGVAALPAVSPTPEAFRATLGTLEKTLGRLSGRAGEKHALEDGVSAAAGASPGREEFAAALEAVAELVEALEEGAVDARLCFRYGVTRAARALPPERFRAGLKAAARLARAGIDPRGLLEHGWTAASRSSRNEAEFQNNAAAVERFIERLAERRIDLRGPVELGLPAVAQACAEAEDFRDSLAAFEQFVANMAARGANLWSALEHGLPAAAELCRGSEAFRDGLEALEEVSAQLEGEGLTPATPPGLEELARRAIELRQAGRGVRLAARLRRSPREDSVLRLAAGRAEDTPGASTEFPPEPYLYCELEPVSLDAAPAPVRPLSRSELDAGYGRSAGATNS